MSRVVVSKQDGESSDRFLKRFSSRVKSLKLIQRFRAGRYFKSKPAKIKIRQSAISREKHRQQNKRHQFS